MDIVNLLISLASGVAGGNIAGASMPEKNLGVVGNSITGLIGGGVGGYILQALGLFAQATTAAGASSLDLTSVLANIGSSGVGGALLMMIVTFVKNSMQKS